MEASGKKDLLSIRDLTIEGLVNAIEHTREVKNNPTKYSKTLCGKTMVMLFEKPSTRTRVSFEAAILQLGGHAINITRNTSQLDRGETVADSAKVLGRYVDVIVARVNSHKTLTELAKNSRVPVINGLSDIEHPCQAIADLFTIYENSGRLKGVNVCYVGDGNNVCNSLVIGCAMTGANIRVATPKGYEPGREQVSAAMKAAKKTGAMIMITENPYEAVKDADYVYTDVWISMGQEKEQNDRIEAFKDYQLNKKLMDNASKNAKAMHCLPAHRGMEISAEVMDSPRSIVWDQAENRLHAQKTILMKLLG